MLIETAATVANLSVVPESHAAICADPVSLAVGVVLVCRGLIDVWHSNCWSWQRWIYTKCIKLSAKFCQTLRVGLFFL